MMKKYLLLFSLVLPAALCLSIQGCKTNNGLIREAFGDYRSDALFFRTVGQGEDKDMQLAKSKAIHRAKLEIARSASSVCQQIVLDYLDQTGNGGDTNLKEQFISVSTESVSASLVNVAIEDVVFEKGKDGRYTSYAKVKVAVENVIDTFAGRSQEKMEINKDMLKRISDKVVNQIDAQP
ncbi:MAG: hypothetical protein LBJ39_06630 [Tannerellaceae bacterium]|jgi:hypothetical protein|nr:hypothetical protein [Tannerellaceae bacterium]